MQESTADLTHLFVIAVKETLGDRGEGRVVIGGDGSCELRGRVTDMSKVRIIKVKCQCGQLLFRYSKGGRGRLIKCYLDQIQDDGLGAVNAPLGALPACPACGKQYPALQ